MKTFEQSCADMTKLIESCWDDNNPNDGLSFDERLTNKIQNLSGIDLKVMQKVMGGLT